MHRHQTISIDGVDAEMLNEQRKLLGDLVYALERTFDENPEGKTTLLMPIQRKEAEALAGVVNMLDVWSDEWVRTHGNFKENQKSIQ